MRNFIPFLILIFSLIILGFSTFKIDQDKNPNQSKIQSFVKSDVVLPEFSLNGISENQNFSKQDLLGKYSLINFFASWCSSCLLEHKILLELKERKIIDIYGIAWRDIKESTIEYINQNKNPYKKIASDSNGSFGKIANVKAVPETWLIDERGNVIAKYLGPLNKKALEEIVNLTQIRH